MNQAERDYLNDIDFMPEYRPEFWGIILHPNDTVYLDIPDNKNIVITSAVIPNLGSNNNPVRIKAMVRTIPFLDVQKIEETNSEMEIASTETLLCTLIPNSQEYKKLAFVYSPFQLVYLKNLGDIDVHISGIMIPISDEIEEEEEEEEANETSTK